MKEAAYFLIPSVIIIVLFIVIVLVQRKRLSSERALFEQVINCCKDTENLTKTINEIFNIISSYVKADEYAFYLIDSKNKAFVLKAVHYKKSSTDNLNVSYSGLIPHKKIKYVFPVNIDVKEAGTEVSVKKEKGMQIISLPIKGGHSLIKLKMDQGFKFNKNRRQFIVRLSGNLEPITRYILSVENLNNRIKVLETAKQATRSVASMISGNGIFRMAINMFAKTINAKGGFFLKDNQGIMELDTESGLSKENKLMFKYDSDFHGILRNILGSKKIATINKKDEDFKGIPIYFVNEGVKQIILFNVSHNENAGIAGFWYDHAYEIDDYQTSSLLLIFSKITEVFKMSFEVTGRSSDGIDTLKMISTLVDDLSPYTVGFSNLMEFYAAGIADEMKLPQTEICDIALAAFLSNIGIATLSYDVFLKKGRYVDHDYEIIKLHSEVGADIIEAICGNVKVANMVRYHHERIDGLGYPHRLKGDEIPIGAKILAVAQFFVAKISPRSYRDATTYDNAVLSLVQVAGKQLDSEVVKGFLAWIERSRLESINNSGSLDFCWNMRCVSSEICNKCPAKMRTDKRCWEAEGNACMAHGNKCETCFIYTEYQGRKKMRKEVV